MARPARPAIGEGHPGSLDPTTDRKERPTMQYLLLIYDRESDWAALSEAEKGTMMKDYYAFTSSIRDSGHYQGGNPLQPVATATTVQVRNGKTTNPGAWLVSTARHKALDRLRRGSRFAEKARELAHGTPSAAPPELPGLEPEPAPGDDRLRLIFTCCHPALAAEAQVALTLHTLCGLSTDEIARA